MEKVYVIRVTIDTDKGQSIEKLEEAISKQELGTDFDVLETYED